MEYPYFKDLHKIETWPHTDFLGLAEFVCKLWSYPECAKLTGKKVKILRLATLGWSGNEEIISALNRNTLFSMTCWEMSKRGGLHVYKFSAPNYKEGNKK